MFAARERPGWEEDVAALCGVVAALPPARTLDVACGTGFLTRHLRGEVTGLDASESMIEIASFADAGGAVRGRGCAGAPVRRRRRSTASSPVTSTTICEPGDRARFLAEARRVASELVVADSALREGVEPVQWQERVLNDGSRHTIYKRFFTGEGLAAELGGERC